MSFVERWWKALPPIAKVVAKQAAAHNLEHLAREAGRLRGLSEEQIEELIRTWKKEPR